jgi:hypothetical protein
MVPCKGNRLWANLHQAAVMHYIDVLKYQPIRRHARTPEMANANTSFDSSMESSLKWLVDRTRISDLLYSFASALDNKDWKRYTENYAENGYVEVPDPQSGNGETLILRKEKMLELVPKSLGRYSATHHISTNHQINIEGDRADSRSYLQAVHVGDKPTDHWTAGGWYDCHYVRTDQGWKFARVKLTAVWLAGDVGKIQPE